MEKVKKEERISWEDAKRIIFWYWRLTKKYSFWLFVTIIAYGIAAVSSQVFSALILKRIVDIISTGPIAWSNALQDQIIILAGLVVVQNILFRLGDLGIRKYQVSGKATIAKYIFSTIHKQSHSFFTDTFVGSIVSQAKRFEDGFGTVSDVFIFTLWWESVVLTSMLITLSIISWPLTIIFLLCIILLFVVTIPAFKQRMQYDAKEGEVSSKLTGYFSDVVSNILNTKIFAASLFEKKRFRAIVKERQKVENISFQIANKLIAIQAGLGEMLGMIMIVSAIWLWSKGEVTAGTILLVISFSQGLFHVIFQFTRSITRMLQSLASAKEMVDIFELSPGIVDHENARHLSVVSGKIDFINIGFAYHKEEDVFHSLNFSIAPGERVGLVGPSGGGKSTITKLLLRFVEPTEGIITIDDQDIVMVKQDDLRNAISYVPQDPSLFHRTLRDNISYGRLDATDEEIVMAAKKAHAHEFIEKLEQGYDTMVGERGVKLSGGQRQRIAIARAILKNAPILVLDEATSALDTISELAIREAVDELIKDKTAIIIAHRLSTVEKMDRIIVLGKNGQIIEEGKHRDLVASGGLYSELWSHQTGGFLPEDEDKELESEENQAG